MKMGKVVVTGGAGFIGSHLSVKLVEAGHDVHVVDNLSSGSRAKVHPRASLHIADVCDREALPPIISGAQTVYHLAALSSVAHSIEDPVSVFAANVIGTLTVFNCARQAGVGRVVYSSSSAVYGDQSEEVMREDLQASPQSPYGLSKYNGEMAAKLFASLYGLETVCLRYFNVYGAGQNPEGPYAAVLAKFAEARRAGRPLQVTGDGCQTRDFIMVDDVVEANLAAATSGKVGRGEAINIGTGTSTSILELALLIGSDVEFLPQRDEIRHSRADISRARSMLGFSPRIALREGLSRMGLVAR